MTPASAIAELDAALLARGEDVTVQRIVTGGTVGASVTCRAMVRALRAEELVGSLTQNDTRLILSPTAFTAATWPLPVRKPDRVVLADRTATVEFPKHIRMAGVLVRIEILVRG